MCIFWSVSELKQQLFPTVEVFSTKIHLPNAKLGICYNVLRMKTGHMRGDSLGCKPQHHSGRILETGDRESVHAME